MSHQQDMDHAAGAAILIFAVIIAVALAVVWLIAK